MRIWTIGHSTRPVDEIVDMLHAHGIGLLVDVRRFPASRRHPQFNRETLCARLAQDDIDYLWLEALGGRRHPRKDSHNTRWHNASFRGYADYMETKPFAEAAAQLLDRAAAQPSAIMCAEQAWQQCHRGLISDWLKVRGIEVEHILGNGRLQEHPWTAAAQIVDGELSYQEGPADPQAGFEF